MADRISTLPASVLCHILSFLPTKQVVATSVLSKIWNPLWRSVSTLHFEFHNIIYDPHDTSEEKYSRFVQWVNEVILSRDLHQPIQTFRLRLWCPLRDTKILNIWVNVALQLGVENLDLFVFSYLSFTPVNLTSSILRHRTLVVLKLYGFKFKSISSVDLPSLKILHLNEVTFSESTYLADLLSGCPVLEDLVTKGLYSDHKHFPNYLNEGEFKRLPKLIRAYTHKRHFPLVTLANAKFLRIDEGYSVSVNLTHQEMDMDPNSYAKEFIPVFHNLVHIELTFFYYTMNWIDVMKVLNHCPKLQILVINQDFSYVDDYEEMDWQCLHSDVPECISLHLKTCHLHNYKGSKGEVQFARYVMQNASILQTMKIHVSRGEELNKLEMLKVLSSCTRCSPTCELSFEIISEISELCRDNVFTVFPPFY